MTQEKVQERYEITLTGIIPSKKNSRQIICRGRFPTSIPSKKHKEWHKVAMVQLSEQGIKPEKLTSVNMTVQLYAKDKRKADASNKLESINDLLVDYGFLDDDNWFVIHKLTILPIIVDKVGGCHLVIDTVEPSM